VQHRGTAPLHLEALAVMQHHVAPIALLRNPEVAVQHLDLRAPLIMQSHGLAAGQPEPLPFEAQFHVRLLLL